MFISPNTIKNHIYNIYQKTGVKNRIQLASIMTQQAAEKAVDVLASVETCKKK